MALNQVVEPQMSGCQRQQLGAGVAVVQVAPQREQDGCHQQRGCRYRPHLDFVDVERFHDRRGQRADQQAVGLVEQHEDEEDAHHTTQR